MADEDLEARIRITATDESAEVLRGVSERLEETARSFSRLAFGTGAAAARPAVAEMKQARMRATP
jgi:hypothetical protein